MPADQPKRRSSSRSRSGKSSGRSSSGRGGSSSSSSSTKKKGFGKKLSRQLGKLTEGIEKGFKVFAEAANGIMDMILSVLFPKNLRKKVDKLGKSKQAKKVSKKVSKQVGKLTDNVEKSFKKGASGFFEVFGFLFAIIVPKFIRDRVSKVWKAAGNRVSKFFKQLNKGLATWAEKYLPPWMLQFLKRTSQRIKTTRKNFSKFTTAWFKSRDFLSLAWSTPAVLMVIPIGVILAFSAAQSDGAKQTYYRRKAMAYDNDGEYVFGQLCRRRLKNLGYMQMESAQYVAALQLADDGDYEGAYEIMKQIAKLSPEFMAALDRNEPQDNEGLQLNELQSDGPTSTEDDPEKGAEDPEITLASGEASSEKTESVLNTGGLGLSSDVTTMATDVAIATVLPSTALSGSGASTESDSVASDATPNNQDEEGPADAIDSPNQANQLAEVTETNAAEETKAAEEANAVEGAGAEADDPMVEGERYKDNFNAAHIWIGFNLLNGNIEESSDSRKWKLIREHARVANLIHIYLMDGWENIEYRYKDRFGKETFAYEEAAALTIACDENEGDSVMARKIQLAKRYDPYIAHVMRHYHAARNYSQATRYASRFVRYMEYDKSKELKEQMRQPNPAELVALIEAYGIMGFDDFAEELAQQGAEHFRDDSLLQTLRALVLRKKLYQLNPYSDDYYQSLKEIHQIDPENEEIARSLARKIRDGSQSERIEDLIEEGTAGVALLLELGDLSANREYDRALYLYDKALEIDPESSRAYNNKAYVHIIRVRNTSMTSNFKQIQLDLALEYANKAIQMDRDRGEVPASTYFETRGQVYRLRREWEPAIDDFGRALNGVLSVPDQRSAYEGLIEIYGPLALKEPDLVRYYEDLLRSLQRGEGMSTRVF